MRTRPLYDYVALLARIGIGIVILAHGWQKIQVGITRTSDDFDAMHVPVPTAAAVYATFVELLGGAALILGLALPVAGVLLFVDMAGAFAFVHADNGVFLVDGGSAKNGFELVLVLGMASLLFAAGGGGRFTIDSRLFPRRGDRPAPLPAAAPEREPAPEPPAVTERASEELPGGTGDQVEDQAGDQAGAASAGTGARPAKAPAERPRLASSIVEDASRDVLVAGRKKRRSAKRSAEDTQPIDRAGGAQD